VRTGEAGGALAVATLRLRAVLAHRRGDHDQAEELFRQAVDLARRQGLGYELALTDDAIAQTTAATALARLRITDTGQRPLLG
jgi:hypothetical protein